MENSLDVKIIDQKDRLEKAFAYLKGQQIVKTQKDISEKTGISVETLTRALKGKSGYLTDKLLRKIANVFDFNQSWLLNGEGEMLNTPNTEPLTSSPYLSRIEQVARHIGYKTIDDFAKINLQYKTKKQIDRLKNASNADITPLTDITKKNDNINFRWLLTGEGNMLTTPQVTLSDLQIYEPDEIDPNDEYSVPLLPISAMGGSLTGFADSLDSRYRLQRLKVPVKGADWAMFVNGDSMAPECPNGSLVVVKRINELAFIEWGKIFVLDTCNGNILKRLKPTKDKRVVLCESINPEYPPFEVNLDDVFNIFVKVMCVSF